MKRAIFHFAAASTLLATVALLTSSRSPEATSVDYKFREAPINSMGITSFAELRGKPVLIDFWGTR